MVSDLAISLSLTTKFRLSTLTCPLSASGGGAGLCGAGHSRAGAPGSPLPGPTPGLGRQPGPDSPLKEPPG